MTNRIRLGELLVRAGVIDDMQLKAALAEQQVTTLRFEFPYMTAGRKRPDPPARLTAAVSAAVEFANEDSGGLPVYAGGKSLGGRMTSTAAATDGLDVKGLVFFGFPLHAPGREGVDRANHLFNVDLPLLFLQGTRDKLAERTRMGEVCQRLSEQDESHPGRDVSLVEIDEADHSFHVPKRTGRTDAEVIQFLAATTASWMDKR